MHVQKNSLLFPKDLFHHTKRDPEDMPESYSEYETDKSSYLPDDVPIKPEPDSDEVEDFVNNTLAVYSVENLDAGLSKVCDGFLLAVQGYEEI